MSVATVTYADKLRTPALCCLFYQIISSLLFIHAYIDIARAHDDVYKRYTGVYVDDGFIIHGRLKALHTYQQSVSSMIAMPLYLAVGSGYSYIMTHSAISLSMLSLQAFDMHSQITDKIVLCLLGSKFVVPF